jgi:hypothetical protein
MSSLLPPAFFFRYALGVSHQADLPRKRGSLLNLPESCRLPRVNLTEKDSTFGDVRMAWNRHGLGISVEVRGKSMPITSDLAVSTQSDGLQVWIDTRNTQTIHRASRYCHHFCFLPGEDKKTLSPQAVELPIARAREERPLANAEDLRIEAKRLSDGYLLEAWLPAKALVGYDPEANPQLGFYYLLEDAELGRQVLTVGLEFPFDQDPSLWSTLELLSKE